MCVRYHRVFTRTFGKKATRPYHLFSLRTLLNCCYSSSCLGFYLRLLAAILGWWWWWWWWWWFQIFFGMFTPKIGEGEAILTCAYFSKGVGGSTTSWQRFFYPPETEVQTPAMMRKILEFSWFSNTCRLKLRTLRWEMGEVLLMAEIPNNHPGCMKPCK